jgi:parallel beta-helix repeat protein
LLVLGITSAEGDKIVPLTRGRLARGPIHTHVTAAARVAAALIVSLALVVAAAAVAQAASSTLYVDNGSQSCSDLGPGTQSQPFCTIGHAASVAAAGNTVIVSTGTYTENVTVLQSGTSGSPIVFSAASGATVTVTGWSHGFTISSKSYITVQGFTVKTTSGDGISVTGSDNVTLSGNDVSYAGQPAAGLTAAGIKLTDTTDSLVQGNTVHHNTTAGIYLIGTTTGVQVLDNDAYMNAAGYARLAPGIDVRSSGNTIAGNVSHDNEDSGLQFYPGGSNSLAVNNLAYDNGDHGIDDLNVTGQRIIGNTIYNNVTAGINVEASTQSSATVENNISVDNGIDSPRTTSNIRIDSLSTAGSTVDYNLVSLRTPGTMYIWGPTSYSSLAAFQQATGQEPHGLQADPKWANPSSHDFHLTDRSPAIDSANSGVSGEQATDLEGSPRHNDANTPNTGAGPRAYDDRGAYEFQGTSDTPYAALSVTPASGTYPVNVTADASGSVDNDATPIASYAFDFGDGTVVGPQGAATAVHTYVASAGYAVTVTVTDTGGLSSSATKVVTVSGPNGDLVGNSGFEADASGWNTSGSGAGVTLARVSGGHTGSWSALLSNGSTGATTCLLNDSPNWVATTATGSYRGAIWVRADTPGATFTLRVREFNGSTLVGSTSTQVTLTTSWQLVTVTYTAVSPGSTTLDFNAYLPSASAPPGACFYADDASIVRS